MPTILSIFGVEGEAVDGYNLLPVMSGAQEGQRDHVITGWATTAGVRTPEWLLMLETVNADTNPRLFHSVADPKEEHNVAAAHPEVVRSVARETGRFNWKIPNQDVRLTTDYLYPSADRQNITQHLHSGHRAI